MKRIALALCGALATLGLCTCISCTTRMQRNPEREPGAVRHDSRDADVEDAHGEDAHSDVGAACYCECPAGFDVVTCSPSSCACEQSDKTRQRIYETALGCDMEEPCPAARYEGDPGSAAVEGFQCLFEALSTPMPGRYFLYYSYFDLGGFEEEYVLIVAQGGDVVVHSRNIVYGSFEQTRSYDLPQRCSLQGIDACLQAVADDSPGPGGDTGGGGEVGSEKQELCLLPRDFLTNCAPLNEFSCE